MNASVSVPALALVPLLVLSPATAAAQTGPIAGTSEDNPNTLDAVLVAATPPPPIDPRFADLGRVLDPTPADRHRARQRAVAQHFIDGGKVVAGLGAATLLIDAVMALGWLIACNEGCATWWYTDFPRGLWTVLDVGLVTAAVGGGAVFSGLITRHFLGRDSSARGAASATVLPWVGEHAAGVSLGMRF